MPALDVDLRALFAADPQYQDGVVRGVFVGGCVDRGDGSRFRAQAHAHNKPGGRNEGWLCFLSPKRLYVGGKAALDLPVEQRRASATLWHEYAHLRTPGHGHDDAWREEMRRLGQPLKGRYKGKYQRGPWKGHYKLARRRAQRDALALVLCRNYDKGCRFGKGVRSAYNRLLWPGAKCPQCAGPLTIAPARAGATLRSIQKAVERARRAQGVTTDASTQLQGPAN